MTPSPSHRHRVTILAERSRLYDANSWRRPCCLLVTVHRLTKMECVVVGGRRNTHKDVTYDDVTYDARQIVRMRDGRGHATQRGRVDSPSRSALRPQFRKRNRRTGWVRNHYVEQHCLSVEYRPSTNSTSDMLFCSCDLDLDLDMQKWPRHSEDVSQSCPLVHHLTDPTRPNPIKIQKFKGPNLTHNKQQQAYGLASKPFIQYTLIHNTTSAINLIINVCN